MKTGINGVFRKSGFVQVVSNADRAIIWHSLFGSPMIVSVELVEFLNLFSSPRSMESVREEYQIENQTEDIISELCRRYYLIPAGFDERAHLLTRVGKRLRKITNGSFIRYLSLIMSEICNFRCTYCIHLNNLGSSERISSPQKLMTFEMGRTAIDCYLEILRKNKRKEATINFGGGEPLLSWPVIERLLVYSSETYGQEFVLEYSINTNSSLITFQIAETLKRFNVQVATSLDGLELGNNLVRRTKAGRGTFDLVTRGIHRLAQAEYPIDGIAVTVNEQNFAYINEDLINWAIKQSIFEVRIDIDVIGMVKVAVEEVAQRLMRIRKYALARGVKVVGFWSRPLENLNDSTIESDVVFCGAVGGSSLCVSPSGTLYPCGYSTTRLGSLQEIGSLCLVEGNYYQLVASRQTGKMKMCQGCMIEGQCGGGCHITQEFAGAVKTDKVKRMCEFYREMTRGLLMEKLETEHK